MAENEKRPNRDYMKTWGMPEEVKAEYAEKAAAEAEKQDNKPKPTPPAPVKPTP